MKKLMIILGCVLFLQGCATSGLKGNQSFIGSTDISQNLATESANQVKVSMPVAKTTLVIDESTDFGTYLAEKLRVMGFGVTNEPAVNAESLAYIVDNLMGEDGVYRVLLEFDDRRFSRLYTLNDRQLVAMGNWSVVTVSTPLTVDYNRSNRAKVKADSVNKPKEVVREAVHVVIE